MRRHVYRLLFSSVILIVMIFPAFAPVGQRGITTVVMDDPPTTPQTAETSAAWLTGWSSRKSHQIQGAPGAGVNYQVEIAVNYGSGIDSGNSVYCDASCQPDFDDIRFTDDDGITLLDYWREAYFESDNATFWVEVRDSLDVAASIYMYYGNPNCTTTSDGFATFVFFDDFNDGLIDTNIWDVFGPWTESGGLASFSITADGGTSVMPDIMTYDSWDMRDKAIVSRWRVNQMSVNREWGMSCANTILDDHTRLTYFLAWNTTGDNCFNTYFDASAALGYDYEHQIIGQFLPSVFMKTEFLSIPSNTTKNSWILNGDVIDRYSGNWFDSSPQRIFLGFYVHGYNQTLNAGSLDMDFDYIYIRNQIGSELTHESWSEPEKWLDGWNYRKSHDIIGSPGAGTNYQIRITVHFEDGWDSGADVYCENKCQPDFDDIRFTDDDGITLLDYWSERVSVSDEASFWIEIKDDLSVDASIYMYYGNSSVASISNGTATFIFFDDYENNNLERWDDTTGPGYSCATDQVVHGTYALKFSATPGADIYKNLTETGNPLTHDFLVHSWVRDDNQLRGGHVPLVKSQSQWWVYACRGYNYQFSYFQGGTDYAPWPYNSAGASDSWFEINVGLSMSTDTIHAWKNGDYMGGIGLIAANGAIVPDDLFQIGFSQQSAYITWWDDTYVRKWIVNEPTHGAWNEATEFNWYHDCSNSTGFVYNDSWNINWMSWAIGSGSLVSDGSALTVSGVPSGTGYHGPVFEYELPSALQLRDITRFSALLHADNSLAAYLGYEILMLGDSDRNPVLFFSFGDGWKDYRQGAYGISYVFTNGSRTGFGSGYPVTWTSFNGVMNVSCTELGLMGFVEGIEPEMITGLTDADLNREIKYVAIASARYGSDPLLPVLVDEISLNYYGPISPHGPSISDAEDFMYEAGTSGHAIDWMISGFTPTNYELYRNSDLLTSGVWPGGSQLSIGVDNLSPSVYNYTIMVHGEGITVSDSVLVVVIDTTAPILDHPLDVMIDVGTQNIQVTWQPTDLYPFIYAIYQNLTLVSSGTWASGENLTYSLPEGLPAGEYNITLIVFDTSGNYAIDTVTVTIDEGTTPGGVDYLAITISAGSIIVIVIVIGLLLQKRSGPADIGSSGYEW
jgi:hypothetical protein